ncbi:MAG: isochorismatase family protein [Verrucomicrobiae bacterium]|nr:isochorismatase family protein [Verrucomicrobiae bacterium]
MLSPERCHLLVIDLQERLLPVMADGPFICSSCRFLMDVAGLLGVPVVLSEQYPRGLGPTVPLIAEHSVAPPPFEKLRFSAADGFCQATSSAGVGLTDGSWTGIDRDQVLVCGIETHVCVQQTCLQLIERGFQVFVAADAVSSRWKSDHELALQRLRDSGVVVTSAEAAAFEFCATAENQQFKQLSHLVRTRDQQRRDAKL